MPPSVFNLTPLFHGLLGLCLSLVLHIPKASAADFLAPPSTEIRYSIKSNKKGIPLSGEAHMRWQVSDLKSGKITYRLSTETRVTLFGKILSASSFGTVNTQGLEPDKFIEKRISKTETTTQFNRINKAISFSASTESYPIIGGEQDRSSVIWQLVGLLNAAGDKIKIGSEITMIVAGTIDAEPWVFKVINHMTSSTVLGEKNTIHLIKAPPPDAVGQRLELWLAPELNYAPVRITFDDASGDHVEQKILSIKKLANL